jgi:hypothetical protein
VQRDCEFDGAEAGVAALAVFGPEADQLRGFAGDLVRRGR